LFTDARNEPETTLKPNAILNHAKVLVSASGGIEKPESISIRGKDELYFGDITGKIIKYHNGKLTTVIQLGFPCGKIYLFRADIPSILLSLIESLMLN